MAFTWSVLVPILMLLPRNLYKINYIKLNYNHNLVDFFEISILILLITTVSYTLGLKNVNIDFDSFSHFINLIIYTLLTAVIYYVIKARNYKTPNKLEVILFAFIFNLIFSVILWERFQYYNDKIFHTTMFYDKFQDINLDTFSDQVFGTCGVIAGSAIGYKKIGDWFRKWKK